MAATGFAVWATMKLVRWSILILRAKAVWLGDVEATSEAEAIAKGAEEFKQLKERLMAVRRANSPPSLSHQDAAQ